MEIDLNDHRPRRSSVRMWLLPLARHVRRSSRKKKHVELGAEKTHGGARFEAMVAGRMLGHQESPGSVSAQALRQEEQSGC